MSRKLGAVALALGILVGAMELKTLVTAKTHGAVITANGIAPLPLYPQRPPR